MANTYSSTKSSLDNGTQIPGAGTKTDSGCGFTTAEDPAYCSATKVNGVTEIKTKDPNTGAVLYQIIADSGAHFGIGEDGSMEFYSVCSPADNKEAGQFKQFCEGKYILKIGKEMHIIVENKAAFENPLSIEVYGNANIKATGGNLNLGGDNVSINAGDVCTINAGRTLQLNAGVGGAGGTAKAVTNLINGVDTGVAGGKVEINAGDFTVKSSAKKNQVNVIYDEISSERSLEMKDPRGTFGIISAGHLEVNVNGDMIEKVGGKKLTRISGATMAVPHPDAPKTETWKIDVGTASEAKTDIKINARKGDVNLDLSAGDLEVIAAKKVSIESKVGGSLKFEEAETTLKSLKNLTIRASTQVQVRTTGSNYAQWDESGVKYTAPAIMLN